MRGWLPALALLALLWGCADARLETVVFQSPDTAQSGDGSGADTGAGDTDAPDADAADTADPDAGVTDGSAQDGGATDTSTTDASTTDTGTADSDETGDTSYGDDDSDDGGTSGGDTTAPEPWPDPSLKKRVVVSGAAGGQCALVDGKVWLGKPGQWTLEPVFAQLAWTATAAWCESPGQLLVIGGRDASGAAHIGISTGPGTQVVDVVLGQGQPTALMGVDAKDMSVVGIAAGSPLPAWSAVGKGTTKGDWTDVGAVSKHPALFDLFVRPDAVRFAVGAGGTVLRSTDGIGWQDQSVTGLTTSDLRGVWCTDNGTCLIVGDKGALLRRNKSSGWAPAPTKTTPGIDWRDVAGLPAQKLALAVGSGQSIALWDGKVWTPVTDKVGLPPVADPQGVAVYSKGPKIWVILGDHPVVRRCELDPKKPSLKCETQPVVGGKGP